MAERYDERNSDEIRRDIEGARTELRETVGALERKLSLGQIIDEVWGRVGGPRTAGAAAASVGDAIRDYPVPLALMGLGVAWLAVDKATGSPSSDHTDVGPGSYGRAEGRVGPYRGDAVHGTHGPSSTERSGAAGTLMDKASSMASKAKGLASDLKEKVTSSGNGETNGVTNGESDEWRHDDEESGLRARAVDAADRARDVAGRAKGMAGRGADKAKHGFRSALDDQPLALGALAFGLGLASGLAAPTTRWEDETMGEAADTVKDEAGTFVKDAAHDLKEVAASAAGAAKDEAERQSGQIEESVKSIATEAMDTAEEEMHNRHLDTEGLKGRAADARDRTQERLY